MLIDGREEALTAYESHDCAYMRLQYPMVSPENIHRSEFIHYKKVIIRNIYEYTYIHATAF